MLEKLSLEFGHVHITGTFRLTTLATQTKPHHFIDLFMVKTVGLVGMGEELAQDIGPGTGSVFFIATGHKRRTHRPAA